MSDGHLHIDGAWVTGHGPAFESLDPASGETLWQGAAADAADVDRAVDAARRAFPDWAARSLGERIACLERYATAVEAAKPALAETIARETGKPLWDATGEVGAMVGKIAISVAAHEERTPTRERVAGGLRQRLTHRPHGVLAVFGPFNFPGHLPNGHIVPALLAGNTVVLKPSELTPATAEAMLRLWVEAGLPRGVLNLVQGGRETGMALSVHPGIDGVLFTGSFETGRALARQMAEEPGRILALEMGGNNPLIVWEAADREAAARLIVQSAFITSGQRCTCARRLVLPEGAEGDAILERLEALIARLVVGAWNDDPEPFMGPLVTPAAAERVLDAAAHLLEAGATALVPPHRLERGDAFLAPGLLDVTAVRDRPDGEVFGPLLQVIRVPDFEAALAEANNTRYGLAAGLVSDSADLYRQFHVRVRAGIANWNRPTTGASSAAPFGGIGRSGNHRPSAYYAADYCAYPMASLEDPDDRVQAGAIRGLRAEGDGA